MSRTRWIMALAAALLTGLLATAARAQDVPIADVGARTHVTFNGAWFWQGTPNGVEDWNAGSLGGGLTYSLPRNLAVQVLYDHGFPVGHSVGALNFIRAEGTLKVYPLPPETAPAAIFIGVGHAWYGKDGVDSFQSNDVKLLVSRVIAPRIAVFGLYARAFTSDGPDDFNYAKVGVQVHALGRE